MKPTAPRAQWRRPFDGIDNGPTAGMNRPELDCFRIGPFQDLVAVNTNALLDGHRHLARKNHIEATVPDIPPHQLGRVRKMHGTETIERKAVGL